MLDTIAGVLPGQVHLLLLATDQTVELAELIGAALRDDRDMHGHAIAEARVVNCRSLDEAAVAGAVGAALAGRPSARDSDLIAVSWGSGSTQLAAGALDAAMASGLPWRLVTVEPTVPAGLRVYDPTANLPIDPVVPLLRRWRYHSLIETLLRDDVIEVRQDQRDALLAEATDWRRALTAPTAAGLRIRMAAAVMRGDGSSGFAVREYIRQHYQELRKQGSNPPTDLLVWAEREIGRRANQQRGNRGGVPPLLGKCLGIIRSEQTDSAVVAAKGTPSGQWLLSPTVDHLNKMGAASEHELRAPDTAGVEALRDHLATMDGASLSGSETSGTPEVLGVSRLALVPAASVLYLNVVTPPRKGRQPIVEIASAWADHERRRTIDPQIRSYLGVAGESLDTRYLLLDSTSLRQDPDSAGRRLADGAAARIRDLGHAAVNVEVIDTGTLGNVDYSRFAPAAVDELLRRYLTEEVGAVVLVPTGAKPIVLSLMDAAQRLAAERGIPFYLRQLVTDDQGIDAAGVHRLPLRFGTDRAILAAALYTLKTVEVGTAVRLLGSLSTGQDLALRVEQLATALRCGPQGSPWPSEYARWSRQAQITGLIADRIEVWRRAVSEHGEDAFAVRAILGACACGEASRETRDGKKNPNEKPRLCQDLRCVRNQLPITHGTQNRAPDLPRLLASRGYPDAQHLLRAAAEDATREYGHDRGTGPALADLLEDLRADVQQRLDNEPQRA